MNKEELKKLIREVLEEGKTEEPLPEIARCPECGEEMKLVEISDSYCLIHNNTNNSCAILGSFYINSYMGGMIGEGKHHKPTKAEAIEYWNQKVREWEQEKEVKCNEQEHYIDTPFPSVRITTDNRVYVGGVEYFPAERDYKRLFKLANKEKRKAIEQYDILARGHYEMVTQLHNTLRKALARGDRFARGRQAARKQVNHLINSLNSEPDPSDLLKRIEALEAKLEKPVDDGTCKSCEHWPGDNGEEEQYCRGGFQWHWKSKKWNYLPDYRSYESDGCGNFKLKGGE